MQVHSVKSQSFGANPSYAIRKSLAKAQVGGKDITELLGLIKEVHPQKYMTMLEENGKVHAIGLSDRIDVTATIKAKDNPKYWKAKRDLYKEIIGEKKQNTSQSIEKSFTESERLALLLLQIDKEQMVKLEQKRDIFQEKDKALKEKYPPIPSIEEPSFEKYGYISLFKSTKGKSFERILGNLTSSLRKIKEQQSPEERALNAINAMFPPYEKHATFDDAARLARIYSRPRIIG
ncbi:hypothetical protein J6Q66_01695 [bacterium]|nr:hypothetical protein [bacterium]